LGESSRLPQFGQVTSKPVNASSWRGFLGGSLVVLTPAATVSFISGMYREHLPACLIAAAGAILGHALATIPVWCFRENPEVAKTSVEVRQPAPL
jgi:hypothetical protein